jgi:hypothetical protein
MSSKPVWVTQENLFLKKLGVRVGRGRKEENYAKKADGPAQCWSTLSLIPDTEKKERKINACTLWDG